MRIALIFTDYRYKLFEENIRVVSNEFGLFPPLGLCFISAIAKRSGHETMIIDAHALKLSPPQILSKLKDFQPDLLGFLLTTFMFHDAMNCIEFLKRETGLPVIVGGEALALYPIETMTRPEIDYAIVGSANSVLPLLLSSLEKTGKPPNLPGICYKDNGRPVINRPNKLGEDFDALPLPDREGLPHHLYHAVMSRRKNTTIMVTSKGCVGNCNFCHLHQTRISYRKAALVIEEIEHSINNYGVRDIEIFDPSFTGNRQRTVEICQMIIDRGIDVDLACRARIDQVDPELLNLMRRAGFKRILYGVESGSQLILDKLCKGITLKQIENSISQTKSAGILSTGFFMIGSPGETVETVEETLEFAIGLELDYAQFFMTMPKPKTILNDIVMERLGYDYWSHYLLGQEPERRLPTPWTDLSISEIENLAIDAYKRYYFRPKRLIRLLADLKNFGTVVRYLRSGFGLLKSIIFGAEKRNNR